MLYRFHFILNLPSCSFFLLRRNNNNNNYPGSPLALAVFSEGTANYKWQTDKKKRSPTLKIKN